MAQDQLEAVLRCAGQLRIRGLESELSRHCRNGIVTGFKSQNKCYFSVQKVPIFKLYYLEVFYFKKKNVFASIILE